MGKIIITALKEYQGRDVFKVGLFHMLIKK